VSNTPIDMLTSGEVAIATGCRGYGGAPPYSPSVRWPEYPFSDQTPSSDGGQAYAAVREALILAGLDRHHVDTERWNPLGDIIRPGNTVVVKPNFVREFRESRPGDGHCLTTHGAVLRPVIDYVGIALRGRGRLIVADAPQNDADFRALEELAGLPEIQRLYRRRGGIRIELYDLRAREATKVDGVIVAHRCLVGDPAGYMCVDLGSRSALDEIDHLCDLLYGSEYDSDELRQHHGPDRHEYPIARTVLDADVVINVPKLKTHKKVGLTACLKNAVGVNGDKNWLPHYRCGTPAEGGDAFADNRVRRRIEHRMVSAFKTVFPRFGHMRRRLARPLKAVGRRVFGDSEGEVVRSGNWYGNDTAWRMVHDLNRILLYADRHGELTPRPVRRVYHIVDAIVAGEGDGPLDARPMTAGCVLAGPNGLAVDMVCARLMGFDYRRLPILRRALEPHPLPLAGFDARAIRCRSSHEPWNRPLADLEGPLLSFDPHYGWRGHIELQEHGDGRCLVAKERVG